MHAVLAEVDLRADAAEVERVGALQARLVGASDAERDAACTAVSRRAGASRDRARGGERRRCAARRRSGCFGDDGRLAEGFVDLAFREPGAGWTVVDFKTDVELGQRRAAYAVQVQLYAEAISRATGEPAEALLLVL